MSLLDQYKTKFVEYLESLDIEIPTHVKTIGNFEFTVFFVAYIKPYMNDLEAGYTALREFLSSKGVTVPHLNDEEKNKVKRYIEAFNEIIEGADGE